MSPTRLLSRQGSRPPGWWVPGRPRRCSRRQGSPLSAVSAPGRAPPYFRKAGPVSRASSGRGRPRRWSSQPGSPPPAWSGQACTLAIGRDRLGTVGSAAQVTSGVGHAGAGYGTVGTVGNGCVRVRVWAQATSTPRPGTAPSASSAAGQGRPARTEAGAVSQASSVPARRLTSHRRPGTRPLGTVGPGPAPASSRRPGTASPVLRGARQATRSTRRSAQAAQDSSAPVPAPRQPGTPGTGVVGLVGSGVSARTIAEARLRHRRHSSARRESSHPGSTGFGTVGTVGSGYSVLAPSPRPATPPSDSSAPALIAGRICSGPGCGSQIGTASPVSGSERRSEIGAGQSASCPGAPASTRRQRCRGADARTSSSQETGRTVGVAGHVHVTRGTARRRRVPDRSRRPGSSGSSVPVSHP